VEVIKELVEVETEGFAQNLDEAWVWLAALPCPLRREETLQRLEHLLKKTYPFSNTAKRGVCERYVIFLQRLRRNSKAPLHPWLHKNHERFGASDYERRYSWFGSMAFLYPL
jgi:hypothetical protein